MFGTKTIKMKTLKLRAEENFGRKHCKPKPKKKNIYIKEEKENLNKNSSRRISISLAV